MVLGSALNLTVYSLHHVRALDDIQRIRSGYTFACSHPVYVFLGRGAAPGQEATDCSRMIVVLVLIAI